MNPCFVYRAYDQGRDLIYVGITGNVGLRLGQHAAQKAWWGDVVDIQIDVHESRQVAKAAESELIRSHSPKYNVHEHPTNRAKRVVPRRSKRAHGNLIVKYKVEVTREGDAWLADVPEVPGAHTFARSLNGLVKAVGEVIVLMDDLPDDAQVHIDLVFSDDDLLEAARQIGRDREELAAREATMRAATREYVEILTKRGLSVRDAATVLDITPGRISQLSNA